jgi:hypothetical protein
VLKHHGIVTKNSNPMTGATGGAGTAAGAVSAGQAAEWIRLTTDGGLSHFEFQQWVGSGYSIKPPECRQSANAHKRTISASPSASQLPCSIHPLHRRPVGAGNQFAPLSVPGDWFCVRKQFGVNLLRHLVPAKLGHVHGNSWMYAIPSV